MSNTKTLEGKTAIVTGGSRGLGAAIGIEFARRGAAAVRILPYTSVQLRDTNRNVQVAITYISRADKARETVQEIERHGARGVAIHADLGNSDFGNVVVKTALKELKTSTIDILGKTDPLIQSSARPLMMSRKSTTRPTLSTSPSPILTMRTSRRRSLPMFEDPSRRSKRSCPSSGKVDASLTSRREPQEWPCRGSSCFMVRRRARLRPLPGPSRRSMRVRRASL